MAKKKAKKKISKVKAKKVKKESKPKKAKIHPIVASAYRHIAESMEEAEEEAKELKPLVLEKMKEYKIDRAVSQYSGSGDSGQVDHVEFYRGKEEIPADEVKNFRIIMPVTSSKFCDKEKRWIKTTSMENKPLSEAVMELNYQALESHHPGWENNDGADGTLEVLIDEKTATLKHNSYYTQSDYSEAEL